MVKFGCTGAAVLALIGVAASHAQPVDGHQYRRHLHAAPPPVVAYSEEPNLPIENALRWGYSQGYSNYPFRLRRALWRRPIPRQHRLRPPYLQYTTVRRGADRHSAAQDMFHKKAPVDQAVRELGQIR